MKDPDRQPYGEATRDSNLSSHKKHKNTLSIIFTSDNLKVDLFTQKVFETSYIIALFLCKTFIALQRVHMQASSKVIINML